MNFFNVSALQKGGGARPSAPRRGAPSKKSKKSSKKWVQNFGALKKKKSVFMSKTRAFTSKILQNVGSLFWLFWVFFQIPSRTWGINFDTIACVFELVDGLKKMFFLFFPKKYFSKYFLSLSIHFPLSEVVKEIFPKFSFFSILSYPILSYPF